MKTLIISALLMTSIATQAQQGKPQPAAKKPATQQAAKPAVKPKTVGKPAATAKTKASMKEDTLTTALGVKIVFKKKGTGPVIQIGQMVKVHYTGSLLNGKKFDSSRDRNAAFNFQFGKDGLIIGWNNAVSMMHEGDRADVIIPAQFGYADKEQNNIPANSTLVFDLEILEVTTPPDVVPFDTKGMTFQTTPSGLKICFTQKGNGRKPAAGNKVKVHYTGRLSNGFKFDSSRDQGEPYSFKVGKGEVIPGWDEAILMMGVGDKAMLIIPPKLAYDDQGAFNQRCGWYAIPPNETIYFEVELVDAIESPTYKAQPQPFNVVGKDTVTTASGLKYIIVNKGNGPKPQMGQKALMHYTGLLLDGKKFDSSLDRGEPFSVEVGRGGVIKGWIEAIDIMNVGDCFRLIIPPSLAYGDRGASGVIPPNATLIFDVELMGLE